MKTLRIATSAAVLVVLALTSSGCGGISGSHSVSPASFFVPGLMKNTIKQSAPGEPTPPTPAAEETSALDS